jgi:sugar/nucleoside kinase (ribokinase family)
MITVMKNIVIVGHVCIDQNASENSSYTAAGSPAMFISTIYQQFKDVNVNIIASYGNDFEEYKGTANLFPKEANSDRTLVYKNETKNGRRSQQALNREQSVPVKLNEELLPIIQEADIIFLAPILPNYPKEYLEKIFRSKKEGSLVILLPQGYFRDFDGQDNVIKREFNESTELLPLVDIVIVSEYDADNTEELVKGWVRDSNLVAIMTLGERGAAIISKEGKKIIPTEPLIEDNIIDSIGAGDIFSAAFAYEYLNTKDVVKAVSFANQIARQSLLFKTDEIKINLDKVNRI